MLNKFKFTGIVPEFDKVFIGFDDQINKMLKLHDTVAKNISNYPPYNIVKRDDDTYVVEMAIAGWDPSQIDIEIASDKITVSTKPIDPIDESMYLFKGISTRGFSKIFPIDDKIEYKGNTLTNGILRLFLERLIPESKKVRKVAVNTTESIAQTENSPQLLQG